MLDRFRQQPVVIDLVDERHIRVEPGFEREFAQQSETKCIDGRDVDFEQPRADVLPQLWAAAKLVDDASSHLSGRFPSEGDSEHVARARALFDEVHVTLDEDAGFSGARGCLESDVQRWIGCELTGAAVDEASVAAHAFS